MGRILEYTKGKNILLLSNDSLKTLFKIRFPEISEIEITKEYPSTIVVKAKTLPIVAKWQYQDSQTGAPSLGVINQKGLFFAGETSEELFSIERVGEEAFKTKQDKRVISEDALSQILFTRKELETLTSLSISSAKYLEDAQEIHFIAKEGPTFWFLLSIPLEEQIEKFKIVFSEKNFSPSALEKIEYFDLRIKKSVIIKDK